MVSKFNPVPGGETGTERRGTTGADRVADILCAFIDGPAALGVTEVARSLGISKAVVHRVFQSLVSREFLRNDPQTRGYRLGPRAAALGARALRDTDMRRAARPVLEALRDATGETTTISEAVGNSRVYLEQFESRQTIRMLVELGRQHPLHAGGSGKAIMAFLPRERMRDLIGKGLAKYSDATITDPDKLVEELRRTAQRGYAVSIGERASDAASVAAPIVGSDGRVIGSLSVCGPIHRFSREVVMENGKRVAMAGAEISRRMGWTGPYPPRMNSER